MNPFIVQWLFDIQERVKNDAQYRTLLAEYQTRSQQMQEVLTTLPEQEWDTVTNFLGLCFSMHLRLIVLAFIDQK